MTPKTIKARTAALATILALAAGLVVASAPNASALGPELAPNRGFELSVAEGSQVTPNTSTGGWDNVASPAHGALVQPILPPGWTFEGSAGLFDHADPRADVVGLGGRHSHSGLRFAAISIPASGSAPHCQTAPPAAGACVTALGAKDTARPVYSVDAAWKSHPIEVTPGGYRLRTFALTELASTGTHIFVGVRWLSASGTPLSVSKVTIAADSWPSDSNFTTDWRDVGGDFAAPVGAAFAQILLGSMGDLFIGQLAFDDVSFRRI